MRQEVSNLKVGEVDKLSNRWNERMTFKNFRVAECFAASEFRLFLVILIKETKEVRVACLEVVRSARNPVIDKNQVFFVSEQDSMLVDNVEFVDFPEGYRSTVSVRLQTVDESFGLDPHSIYLSNLAGFVSRKILCDWERSVTGGVVPVGKNQLVGQVVKGATQVMNDISSDAEEVEGRLANITLDRIWADYLSTIKVRLTQANVSLRFTEPSSFRYEVIEMCLGPLKLGLD